MRIDVLYADGLRESYATASESALTANSIVGAPLCSVGTTALAAMLRPRLDLVGSEGLRVDVYWYSTAVDAGTARTETDEFGIDELANLNLEPGRVWQILPPEDMVEVEEVDIDGSCALRRVGPDLADMARLGRELDTLAGAMPGSPLVDRVAALFDAERRAWPSLDEERLLARMGVSEASLEWVRTVREERTDGGSEGFGDVEEDDDDREVDLDGLGL
ncbi:MAG: hypothetical protein UHI81_08075 [Olegusella sp.]|nr:hypothetical protein [Olegusella sp.]